MISRPVSKLLHPSQCLRAIASGEIDEIYPIWAIILGCPQWTRRAPAVIRTGASGRGSASGIFSTTKC
jgi:hypothetical protein